MVAISMCSNNDCELKNGCLRFIAIPNKYSQSYMAYPKKDCEEKCHELFIDAND
jgi:hypothetical protein